MTTTDHDSSAVLCQEISGDARRQGDEILACARQDAEALLGREGSAAIDARLRRLEEARSEAARRRDLTLATVFVETRRLYLARIEELLESVRVEAQKQFTARNGFDLRESVINLASEAVKGMRGDEFIVRLAEKNRSVLGEALPEEIASRTERPGVKINLSWDPRMSDDGPVVTDAAENQVWDNRYCARLERLWPQMRRAIAGEMFPAGAEGPEGGIT
jgi:vacuolar-type H+-ATPase subunit E/Vma4